MQKGDAGTESGMTKQKRMADAILFKNSVLGKRSEQDQEPSPRSVL